MRNAFVVLVSCIGLASGFIVPSSVPESTSKKSISKTGTTKDVTVKPTTSTPKYSVLPKSRTDIDEKDLYEHATEKENNQNERSFIYINQKFSKKPIRNKLIRLLPKDKPAEIVSPAPAAVPNVIQIQTPSSIFNSGPNFNSHFQEFNLDDNKQQQEMSPYFAVPNLYGCKFNEESKKIDNTNAKIQVPASNRVDVRRDYFELLKPPILRPTLTRIRSKVKFDNIHEIKLPSLSPTSSPYRENYIKKYNLKNQYIANAKAAVSQNEMRKKYGFDVAFIRRPAFAETKGVLNRAEDATFEGDFVNDYDYRRPWENHDEDKLLDKYLKDTLEERELPMINENDKINANINNQGTDCVNQECISPNYGRNYINNGLLIKPECPCRTRDILTTSAP